MKRILAFLLCILLCLQSGLTVCAGEILAYEDLESATNEEMENKEGIHISTPSAILMEASTGQVIYEKASKEQLPPASVTKIMTLLLIFDAIEAGKVKLEDTIAVSEFAASMGGSQVFLEPGEMQTLDTMIKCIAVASANDACVAVAEHISGSEDVFVQQMNERAKTLGMESTTFINCNGLDADGHVTTAMDIALMSRELITKYPDIRNYSTIWMENITHTTKKGTTEFGLTNTNKLIRQYQYATGLKTGSTSKAKYCVSATAEKDGLELIAVIMAAPDYKVRFEDATTLLNYGFGKCAKYADEKKIIVPDAKVIRGEEKTVPLQVRGTFQYIDTTGADLSTIKRKIEVEKELEAPIKKDTKVGSVNYYLDNEKIGESAIFTADSVRKMTYKKALLDVAEELLF